MDSKLPRTTSWWILILIMSSTLPHFLYSTPSRRAEQTSFSTRGRIHGNMNPQLTAVQQEQGAGLSLRPQSVVVNCYPGWMRVVVQADMFDTGLQVEGTHLRLGSGSLIEGSACGAVPSGEAEFTIQAHLSDCGTELSSTREKIIYSNVLVYSPEPSSGGLLRLDGATIPVACHYERRNAVGGISLHPIWVPSVSRISAEDHIDFNLLIMTDDWQFEKGSYSFFLGDPIHFQVSAIIGNHIPLRVYVDHCVATATPDADTTIRYDFIENYGCLADAYLTNSNSHFLPRIEEHKLRFQLEAFRFYQETSNLVYITCYMKAVPAELTVSSQNRACSLIDNRWWSVDGNDQACRSCDVSHRVAQPLPTERPKTIPSERKTWPSKTEQQSSVQSRPEQPPANYYRVHPSMHQNPHGKPRQSSAGVTKRGLEYNAERTIQLGPITVLPPREMDKTIRF